MTCGSLTVKTLKEQLSSAQRELMLRKSNYPKWVARGHMMKEVADHELACQEAIIYTLQRAVWLWEVSEEMKAKYRETVDAGGDLEVRPPNVPPPQ